MATSEFRYGFRIAGSCSEPRRLIDAGAAFAAYAACDPRAECGREAYLSAFRFGADFADHLRATGSAAGFSGPCWSPWLWFDIDAEDLGHAHSDAAALAAFLVERYGTDPDDLLLFFSGSKGFHLGLPTALWSPPPSSDFARTARRFAGHVAEQALVTIDAGVYDRVRAFRAPNSRHPKTGLHKRRLSYEELLGPLSKILERTKTPVPFDVTNVARTSATAAADWQVAVALVARAGEAKAARRAAGNGTPTLNRSTLEFIRQGAATGDRHRLLFSAAANLGEFGCPPVLAVALLEESALDSGLSPKEVRRQIDCGLAAAPMAEPSRTVRQEAPGSAQRPLDDPEVRESAEADAVDAEGFNWQTGQQMTTATSLAATDLQAALARLWATTATPKVEPADAASVVSVASVERRPPVVLPPDPPPLVPLPPGAVGSGKLDPPCRCGSTEYAEIAITEGRTRLDCRRCSRFVAFGRWHKREGGDQ